MRGSSHFGADGETEVVTGSPKAVHFMRHLLPFVGIECAVISKQEVPDDSLLHLCHSLQVPQGETSTVSPVSDRNTILAVAESIRQHGRKDRTEHCRDKSTVLLHTFGHCEGF